MRKKIYFGEVIIMNLRTKEKKIIPEMLFKEGDTLADSSVIIGILHRKPQLKKDGFRVLKLCYESARQVGETVD